MASPMNLVVIGGVAGGMSAAARARRLNESANIVVFEKGPDPSFANCGMPYYLGGEITNRASLNLQTPASLKARLNLDVRTRTEVIKINRAAKTVTAKNLQTGEEVEQPYDHLILSVGATPVKPPIPGIDRPGNLILRNLDDMDSIHKWINEKSAKKAVVCGAGFIGVEMAEQLKHRGMEVTLVEGLPQIMAPLDPEMAAILHAELEKAGIKVLVNSGIVGFEESTTGAIAGDVVLKSGDRLPGDVVILGLGVRADSNLAKEAGLDLNPRGGIVVDEHMKTSDPCIWAVGDAIEVPNPILGGRWMVAMAGPANRQGRMVADIIMGSKSRSYRGTIGTSVLRCCSLTAACTGINEKGLKAAGRAYHAIHIHPRSHAGYYPGSAMMTLKVLFSPSDGKLLGAQAVGADKVEKRIDVLATALYAGMTMDDLAQLELCYAPPFGSAKDPVNFAGMVGQNMLEGLVKTVSWDQLGSFAEDANTVIVDVRGPKEIETQGKLHEKAINIPVDDIRARIGEIPAGRRVVVSCYSGQRSYYAARILMQKGFSDVYNLDGAYTTWSHGVQSQKAAAGAKL